ncbi:MAG: tRNA (guanosine(46)-N7)-methyltransferase TrmB [Methylacidiphilales bacterium]|nr:tRNA (guanosine(46)-N7)-methyltransferase TrmB [Candidatus Methylacidiphilales bacterium]
MEAGALVPITDICRHFDWRELFGNDHPVELDLGAGDGGFALAYAQQHPEINLLAVERLLGRVRKIAKRAARAKVTNLRVLRLEFGYTVRYLLPPQSVSVAHILFPDPWPKRRHWPRRLIQPDFIRDLAAAFKTGGELRFTTDHEHYFETAQQAVAEAHILQRAPEWDWTADPKTDFQLTFDAEGRPTYRARWIRP